MTKGIITINIQQAAQDSPAQVPRATKGSSHVWKQSSSVDDSPKKMPLRQ